MVNITLSVPEDLKRAAEHTATEQDTTLQDVFQRALKHYIEKAAVRKAKKIVFKTHDLGAPLDHLTRADYYAKP